jgi:flagellar biosynthesis chaperone FliJ
VNRRFRLEPLERLRATELERATRALAAARRALDEAVAVRDGLAAALAVAVPGPHTTPGTATAAGLHREALRARIADAEAARGRAREHVDAALTAWQAARARLRVVENLHDRHRAAMAAADARRDQLVLDDLAAQVALRRPA